MLQILDDNYSNLQPVMSKTNGVVVFNKKCATIAFKYLFIDLVIVLNEKTGKFAYCYNLEEVEEFLNNENINN